MRRGVLLLGQLVHGVLVLGSMIHAGNETEFVERPRDKWGLRHQSRQADVTRRLQAYLVERRREVVRAVALAALAEGLRIGDGWLALAAKCDDGIADFLDLRGAQSRFAHARNQSDHTIVRRGPFHR